MNESFSLSRSSHSGVLFSYSREPTPGAKLRQSLSSRQNTRREGFGSTEQRFAQELTFAPGAGTYDPLDVEHSTLVLGSPSLSKKGYIPTFRSKSPRLSSPYRNVGNPGPATYDFHLSDISYVSPNEKRPTTAFMPSGRGRVPFPPPNPVPGPNAYTILDNPGQSPILKKKPNSIFESKTGRDGIFKTNDVPAPGSYQQPDSPLSARLSGDVQWTRSAAVRFTELGKDNKVPGPQRYFDPRNEEEYFPRKSLRSSGAYRGKYLGKLQQKGPVLSTFGVQVDRFKNGAFGRLEQKRELPGPGAYFHDGNGPSSFSPPPSRSQSPSRPPPQSRSSSRRPVEALSLNRDYIL
eukprot:gene1022-1108_t